MEELFPVSVKSMMSDNIPCSIAGKYTIYFFMTKMKKHENCQTSKGSGSFL